MGYSDKFPPPEQALSEADAMALAQEAFAAAGFGGAGPFAADDARSLYPEHIAIIAVWLGCVAVAAYRLI